MIPSQAEREEIRTHLRWNFTWSALSDALYELGTAFVNAGTVLAAFLTNLTGSALAVGAAESIRRYGWLVSQPFSAGYARGRRYRKPLCLFAGGVPWPWWRWPDSWRCCETPGPVCCWLASSPCG